MHEKKLRDLWRQLCVEYPELLPYRFKLDGRSSRRLGVCKFRTKEIMVSRRYVEDPHFPYSELEDTLLHEAAHALAGSQARHGPEWQAQAIALGARPTACATGDAVAEAYKRQAKWRIWCTGPCGFEGYRSRLAKKYKRWVTHPAKCRCGGRYHVEQKR